MTLPECFNSPYGTKYFPEYAEEIPNGESFEMLSKAAKENNIFSLEDLFRKDPTENFIIPAAFSITKVMIQYLLRPRDPRTKTDRSRTVRD